MGVTKNTSSAPSRRSSLDGSPPYKRRRSDHQSPCSPVPPTTPAATLPTAVKEHTRYPPSSSADCGEQLQQHKLEGRSSDSDSPVPPLLPVGEGFEESADGSLDLKALHVADTEQLKEITVGFEKENVLKIGAAFSTFKEFEDAFNTWADNGHHPMSRSKSHRNFNPLQPDHPYVNISYVCKHHGEPRSRGKNIRPNQKYFSLGCPVLVKVSLNFRPMKYFVRQLVADHNHVVSAELRAQYPDRRMLLDTCTEETITQLVDDNVKPKEITTFLTDNFGKTLYAKDIHNMKKRRLMKPKDRILVEVSSSPTEENVAHLSVPDGSYIKNDGHILVQATELDLESVPVPVTSVSHDKDKLKEPVIHVNKRKSTSSTPLVQDKNVQVKVVPVSQVSLPVIHVKRNAGQLNIPVSRVGKMIMVRTKPKNVILIHPSVD